MAFEQPWYLLALLLAIPVFIALRRSERRTRAVLKELEQAAPARRFFAVRLACLVLFIGCLALIPSRPYVVPRVTGDYVFLVDVSRSMQASNYCGEPTFLDRSKQVLRAVLEGVPEGRFGIFIFDRLAFPVTQMTYDHAYLSQVVDDALFIGMTYEATRTNIANALQVVAQKKQSLPTIYGGVSHVILVSDGHLTEADWRQDLASAIGDLNRADIAIAAIGVGNSTDTPIHVTGPDGDCREDLIEIDGEVVSIPLRRDTLVKIAEESFGRYFGERDVPAAVEYLRTNGLINKPGADVVWTQEQRTYLGRLLLVPATLAFLFLLLWERY